MLHRSALVDYVNGLLDAPGQADYCPNGLQVEGRAEIHRLVTGVTASRRFLESAIEAKADAVLVHHGFFWKGESAPIVGMKAERIRLLLDHGVNLLAYHLPLDIHPSLGNNACLAQRLELEPEGQVTAAGVAGLLWYGRLRSPLDAEQFSARLEDRLDRTPMHIAGGPAQIERVAWCSGGGQRFVTEAAALGVDAYFSGEISEQTTHEAREQGVHYFAAGHHATERGGVQALGAHLASHFGLEHVFIDDPNPA